MPEAFWKLTPREWELQIGAAVQLQTDMRNRMAITAWVGAHADKEGLESFVSSSSAPLPPEGLDRMLMNMSAGLREISMEEYLNGRSH